METILAAVDTGGDANFIWIIVAVLAIIALFMFILGRR